MIVDILHIGYVWMDDIDDLWSIRCIGKLVGLMGYLNGLICYA